MAAESRADCVGNIKSGYRVQWCCDMLLRGAEKRKGQGQRFVKMDPKLAGDDAGEVGHGHTSAVDIGICSHVRIPLTVGKEKGKRTCSAAIDAFGPSKI